MDGFIILGFMVFCALIVIMSWLEDNDIKPRKRKRKNSDVVIDYDELKALRDELFATQAQLDAVTAQLHAADMMRHNKCQGLYWPDVSGMLQVTGNSSTFIGAHYDH